MKLKTLLRLPALLLVTANLVFSQTLEPRTTLWSNNLESNTVGQSTGVSPAVINGFRFNFPGGVVRDSSLLAPFGPDNKYLELSPNNNPALTVGYRVPVIAVMRAQYVATPVGISFDFNESTNPGFGTIIGFGTGTTDSSPDLNDAGSLCALQFRNGVITLGARTSIVEGVLPAFTEGKTYRITYVTNFTSDTHEVLGPDGVTFMLDPMQAGFWMYDPQTETFTNRLVINNNNNRNLDAHIQLIFRHFSAAEESQRQTIYVDNLLATTFAEPAPRWVGNGSDANWTTPANWLKNEAPDPGSELIFTGNQNLAPNNNFAADTHFSGILFDASDSSFTLTGNRIELVGSLANNTAFDQTLQLPVRIDSPLTATNTNATTTLTLGGAIGGTGSITKKGAGTVVLSGANDFAGPVNVDQASLVISGDQSACPASWIVRGFGASGTANNTVASSLTFSPGAQIVVPSGKAVQAGHTSAVNGTQLQSILSSASVINNGTLFVGRSGRLTLDGGAWTQNGTSTIATQGGGTAILTVNTGASFSHANVQELILRTSLSLNAVTRINLSGGTLNTGARIHNDTPTLAENNYSAITLTSGGALRLAANIDDLFTTAGAGIRFFVGSGGGIIDTNGFNTTLNVPVEGAGGLTKSGPGSLTTTGSNSYSGDTVVTGGSLTVVGPNLSDESSVSIADGAMLNLDFAGQDTIAGLSVGGTTLGAGTYDAVSHPLFIGGSGQLLVVPQIDTFGSWALDLGLSGDAGADFDADGIPDALEFVLGTDPKAFSSTNVQTSSSGENLVLIFSRDDRSETADLTLQVEAGTNLVTWPQVITIADTSTPGVTVEENGEAPDTITVIIPKNGATQLFTRIKTLIAGE